MGKFFIKMAVLIVAAGLVLAACTNPSGGGGNTGGNNTGGNDTGGNGDNTGNGPEMEVVFNGTPASEGATEPLSADVLLAFAGIDGISKLSDLTAAGGELRVNGTKVDSGSEMIQPNDTVKVLMPKENGGNDTGGNNTGGNNTGGNDTGGNDTGGNNTGGNNTGGNDTGGNKTGGNHTGGYDTGGNNTGGNDTGGNDTGGNNTGGNNTGGNNTGGNDTGGNNTGGNDTGGETTKPSIPTNVKATAESSSSISVSWSEVSGATSYKVYRAASASGTKTEVETLTTTTYTDTGLKAKTTYYYFVTAVNSGGESGYSSSASAETKAAPPPKPNTPYSIAIETPGSTSLTLYWDSASGATGYKLYRRSSIATEWVLVYTGTARKYKDTGLIPATTYYYRVTAVNAADDESDPSKEIEFMTYGS
jgi:hypothetical protein